ncbi:MAG: hypothetical protein QOI61_722, partial [Actinomycetota bacterium]
MSSLRMQRRTLARLATGAAIMTGSALALPSPA